MSGNGCFLPTSCVLRQKGTLSLRALLPPPPIFSSHKCFTCTCCTVESARVFKYSWKHLEDRMGENSILTKGNGGGGGKRVVNWKDG